VGACQFPGATLAGMAFKVNREPEPPLSFGDKDKFEIVNGGVPEDPSSEQDKSVHQSRDVGEH
jgi:hypothetical protein